MSQNSPAEQEDAIRHSVRVPALPQRAFDVFVRELAVWWPPEYTWSGDVLETIAIEPREGGRCFERGPHHFECDWGRVLVFAPPDRIVFTWQISPRREPVPDPAKASEVEVRFEADGSDTTQVTLEHRHFARHGEGSANYRAALASPQGWPYILDGYAHSVERGDAS